MARAMLVARGEAIAFELKERGFPEEELEFALAMFESVDPEDFQEDHALEIMFLRSRIQWIRAESPRSPLRRP